MVRHHHQVLHHRGRQVPHPPQVPGSVSGLSHESGPLADGSISSLACGATEDLEFDHIDPSTKVFAVMAGLSRAWDALVEEASKCQLLCLLVLEPPV